MSDIEKEHKTLTLREFCEQTGMGWPLPSPGSPEAEAFLNKKFPDLPPIAYLRAPLSDFAVQMEMKLRKNDHKNALGWHKQPIEALVRLMALEFEEFKVSDEFYPVERAREELVDIANFALILFDRLGILQQDKTRHEQDSK